MTDPLTTEDERNVHELKSWYKSDMEIKKSIDEVSERISRLEVGLKANSCRENFKASKFNRFMLFDSQGVTGLFVSLLI